MLKKIFILIVIAMKFVSTNAISLDVYDSHDLTICSQDSDKKDVCELRYKIDHLSKYCFIKKLVTKKDNRTKGYATELLAALCDQLDEKDYIIELEAEPIESKACIAEEEYQDALKKLESFYKKRGFIFVSNKMHGGILISKRMRYQPKKDKEGKS